jgi:hypothetical protein
MNQPLAALASPVPRPITAQLRHTQSGLDTFPAQRVAWLLPVGLIDERARPAIMLNERAHGALPKEPQFHRALNDDMLVDVLRQIALRLSHGLR